MTLFWLGAPRPISATFGQSSTVFSPISTAVGWNSTNIAKHRPGIDDSSPHVERLWSDMVEFGLQCGGHEVDWHLTERNEHDQYRWTNDDAEHMRKTRRRGSEPPRPPTTACGSTCHAQQRQYGNECELTTQRSGRSQSQHGEPRRAQPSATNGYVEQWRSNAQETG